MRTLIAAALAGFAVAGPQAGTTAEWKTSNTVERAFAPSGRVRMDLSAGGYRISGTADNRIRLQWTVRDPGDASKVRTNVNVRGSEATVSAEGPSNNFRVDIQLPARVDLTVRLSAGELKIKNVAGNKDVEMSAGEMDIDVDKAEDYRRVDASVWAGEIHAVPFNAVKGGLFRTFDWTGHGAYNLHAKLKAGEIRFREAGSPGQ